MTTRFKFEIFMMLVFYFDINYRIIYVMWKKKKKERRKRKRAKKS